MRKRLSKQDKPERSLLTLRRILVILIILFIIAGMIGVMASNERLTSVKIVLSSGYEMNIMTTNKKVSDILSENHIIVLEDESVTPDLNSELSDNKTIVIKKGEAKQKAQEIFLSADEILQSYTSIIEKIVTVQEEIPFETITKDVSNGSGTTQNRVVQIGVNGLKQVTYKIKYQNGEEIEKTEISSEIIQEPVDKIVEVRTKTATSRGGSASVYQQYAETLCNSYGWSATDVDCLINLWNKESGWNPYAYNPSTGAYGIPQALPASKMATKGSDYQTNYQTQIKWGLSYISSRYGNPQTAWNHWLSKGWY